MNGLFNYWIFIIKNVVTPLIMGFGIYSGLKSHIIKVCYWAKKKWSLDFLMVFFFCSYVVSSLIIINFKILKYIKIIFKMSKQ